MTIAAIDIGTNTVLMLVARVGADGELTVLADEHAIARLGRGVDASRTILPETFDRLEGFLLRYRAIAESLGAETIVAVGTSAMRDARNRDELVAAMKSRTGIEIEVLGGDDEATWTYRGALYGLPNDGASSAVLDIGGGSTELALGDGRTVERAISIDIGAVRISERFFPSLPPEPHQLDAARAWATDEMRGLFDVPNGTRLVGVAGTVTTLGAMARGLERFDADELNGTSLSLATIDATLGRLAGLTREQTAAITQIAEGRADIILGGATILAAALRRLALDTIIVSTHGLRYGIALRHVELNGVRKR